MTEKITQGIEYLASDPVIGSLINAYGPCTLTPQTEYFAVLCDSIISQQISVKAAEAIYKRFRSFFPPALTPDKVAGCSAEQLKSVGLSAQKARYLLDLAEKFASGEVAWQQFAGLSNERVIEELTKVKGIGRWTAEMFLIFALNRLDVLPVDDLGIRKAVKLRYGLANLASAEQIRLIGANWSPYETIACWYLWRSLENAPNPGGN